MSHESSRCGRFEVLEDPKKYWAILVPLEITKRESGHVTNLVLHVLTMFF